MALGDAAREGYVPALMSLRDELADSISETTSAHGKAALAKVFLETLDVLEEHAGVQPGEGATGLDEFTAALRAKRSPGAAS